MRVGRSGPGARVSFDTFLEQRARQIARSWVRRDSAERLPTCRHVSRSQATASATGDRFLEQPRIGVERAAQAVDGELDLGGLGAPREQGRDVGHQVAELDRPDPRLLDRMREIEVLAQDRADPLGLAQPTRVAVIAPASRCPLLDPV